ncbi:MAG: glycosyltransferase family 2 protein [Bacteroidales bacterium]|nr:glycosyltransferase family 2 protein [Bacteroidales bacterium]
MLFSVIIPLYNKTAYVAKAIHSVLAQSFSDYELVIVDDGSKDDSVNVAAKVVEGRDCCRIIRQENAGVSMARNKGVAVSTGDYLCFLDADDWWEPTFLEELSNLIKEFPEAGIYGANYTIVNETKHKTRVAPLGMGKDFKKGYINYCQVYAKTLAMPLTSISVAIPRKVFDEMKGFPKGIKLGEDFMLWIHIALKYKVAFLNKPLAYYNQDVDAANRGVGHLYQPYEHMLWNLTDLEPHEKTNEDYKKLIDRMRVNGLLKYYASSEYHLFAKEELAKVNWDDDELKHVGLYRLPRLLVKLIIDIGRFGSQAKQLIINRRLR